MGRDTIWQDVQIQRGRIQHVPSNAVREVIIEL